MIKRIFFATAAVAMLLASIGAHAQTLETIRVRLPNGQLLSLTSPDEYAWRNDARLVSYDRYYYEPEQRVYVVYTGNGHPNGHYLHGKAKGHHKPKHKQVVVVQPRHYEDRAEIDHNNRHGRR